jgi:hypothetical protein
MGHESNRRQSKNLLPGTIYVMPTHSSLRKEFSANAITYLKLSNRRLGLLINFNVTRIKDGIKRVALKRFTTEAQRTQRFTENK